MIFSHVLGASLGTKFLRKIDETALVICTFKQCTAYSFEVSYCKIQMRSQQSCDNHFN